MSYQLQINPFLLFCIKLCNYHFTISRTSLFCISSTSSSSRSWQSIYIFWQFVFITTLLLSNNSLRVAFFFRNEEMKWNKVIAEWVFQGKMQGKKDVYTFVQKYGVRFALFPNIQIQMGMNGGRGLVTTPSPKMQVIDFLKNRIHAFYFRGYWCSIDTHFEST